MPRTFRQLALVWGVIPELVPHCNTYDEMVRLALEAVQRQGLARAGRSRRRHGRRSVRRAGHHELAEGRNGMTPARGARRTALRR